MTTPPEPLRLLVFDLDSTGHHPAYIRHLVTYWRERSGPEQVDVVISPDFMILYPDMVAHEHPGVQFQAVSEEEYAPIRKETSVLKRTRLGWQLLRRYTRKLQPNHVLVMYLDVYQPAILSSPALPCTYSAIYFRPDFYYHALPDSRARHWRERAQRLRKRITLWLLLRQRNLKTLFCLDPLAVSQLNQIDRLQRAVWLPDPVQTYEMNPDVSRFVREQLGVDESRKMVLNFGLLDDRKGITEFLQAISNLSEQQQRTLCMALVGPILAEYRKQVDPLLSEVQSRYPVQVIRQHNLVGDRDVQPYFLAADIVLALYSRHIGMSSVLVRAAAARKPVLASPFGLVGALVKQHRLGLTADEDSPTDIARQLGLMMDGQHGADPVEQAAFAAANTAERFAGVIFNHLLKQNYD